MTQVWSFVYAGCLYKRYNDFVVHLFSKKPLGAGPIHQTHQSHMHLIRKENFLTMSCGHIYEETRGYYQLFKCKEFFL